jgi:hypothetical protein
MPLRKSDPIEKWIKDFIDSDAPQFKGKSKKERIDMAKGAYYSAQNESTSKKPQDSDVDDLPGSQPKGYYKGVDKKDKEARAKHFARKTKMDDNDPRAYTPAPGDEDVETKPSKHTNKFKKMFGEEVTDLTESNIKKALQKKAEKSGMPYGILKKVYDRGVAAWRTGHRPGTTPEQWGLARVNSFATKSKGTWGKADADLAKQVNEEIANTSGSGAVDMNPTGRHKYSQKNMFRRNSGLQSLKVWLAKVEREKKKQEE